MYSPLSKSYVLLLDLIQTVSNGLSANIWEFALGYCEGHSIQRGKTTSLHHLIIVLFIEFILDG